MLPCDTEMPQVTKGFRSTSLTLTPCSLLTNIRAICNTDLSLTGKKASCSVATFKTSSSWRVFGLLVCFNSCLKFYLDICPSPISWGTQGAGGEGSH